MGLVCNDQKKLVADLAKDIDLLIASDNEPEVEDIICKYNDKSDYAPAGGEVLNALFFIWIGCIKPSALEYIDVWQASMGEGGKVDIYFDGHFLLFNCYANKFRFIYGVTKNTPIDTVVEWQNHFNSEIDQCVAAGYSFDEAFIQVVNQRSPAEARSLERELASARQYISRLSVSYNLVDIRDHLEVFFDEFFYETYWLELTLRANAAAAADILRLLILYQRGGVYIDVDTLPSLMPVYGPLSDRVNCNVQNVVRAEYFLRQQRSGGVDDKHSAVFLYERYLDEKNKQLLPHIRQCAEQWGRRPLPFPRFMVHENLIAMAALDTLYEYNNNVLVAVKKSKLVKIILREIKRRYQVIFNNGFDVKPGAYAQGEELLSRLANYRFDAMNSKENVTLVLTGPILILEVVLGVAYEILSLDKSISPLAISYALRLNCIAVACTEHTCYTPEHMRSTWR
jgi:hypothetical protein